MIKFKSHKFKEIKLFLKINKILTFWILKIQKLKLEKENSKL